MVFTRFLSSSMLCEKNNSNLWFYDLGILKLLTTLKIKLKKKSIFTSRTKTRIKRKINTRHLE